MKNYRFRSPVVQREPRMYKVTLTTKDTDGTVIFAATVFVTARSEKGAADKARLLVSTEVKEA